MLSRKIKVLFTIPNFDTAGSGKALLNIARRLDPVRFDAHIMCKHDRGELMNDVRNSGIPVHLSEYETPMRPIINGVRGCWKVSRFIRKIKPDIVHSFHYSSDYSEATAAILAGSTWVFTKKNMSWGGSSSNSWRLRSFLAKRIVIQNSDMSLEFYPGSNKTSLIPRGVDTKYFSRDARELNAGIKSKIILCVANLVPIKGVEVLLAAFQRISEAGRGEGWRVKIVGDDDNEYGASLKSRFSELISKNKLHFTGKVSDVRKEMKGGSIFVLPTLNKGRREGSPVSLLEAMSMGLIVVGSHIPGIKDQLGPLNENHMFEPGSVSDLCEKLEGFMNLSEEDAIKRSQEIARYCRNQWDIAIEIKKHEEFYYRTLGIESS